MRIFLDANILFSAAKSDGAVRQLLAILAKRRHTLCVDGYVIEEARRNLAAKFPASLPDLDGLLTGAEFIPVVARLSDRSTYGLPEKDLPIMAAAISGRCDVLLTGDKTHFGSLYRRDIEGVQVLSPAMLVELIARRRK